MPEASMSDAPHVWALVLAGGDGSRLRALTTQPCGTAVPKQFCSLHGGHSLLEDALARAAGIVDPARICAIVAEQHRQWWSDMHVLDRLPPGNVIVQPRNRGTAIGVLYSLLHIMAKDPRAQVLLLPADHYVRDEPVLHGALTEALARVARRPDRPVLLGLVPDEVDTDLGYILPGQRDPAGGFGVARFVEKPRYAVAAEIIGAGGLWNAFIIAADAQRLIDMYLPRHAWLVMEMQVIVSRALASTLPAAGWPGIVDLYGRLPDLDFSRDLLEGHEGDLCTLPVPPCGWSDLGTPRRVGETLRRLSPREMRRELRAEVNRTAPLDLAIQHERFERSTQLSAPV
jgi:mannose-1-phosphate guanylyltransferase